jgi:hypothetical protein
MLCSGAGRRTVYRLQREGPAREDRVHGHGGGLEFLYFDDGNFFHGGKLLQGLFTVFLIVILIFIRKASSKRLDTWPRQWFSIFVP